MKVHITQGDYDGRAMIISWVTPQERHPNVVTFWAAGSKHKHKSHSSISTYKYFSYSSGYIHHATIKHLEVSNGFSIPSVFGLLDATCALCFHCIYNCFYLEICKLF